MLQVKKKTTEQNMHFINVHFSNVATQQSTVQVLQVRNTVDDCTKQNILFLFFKVLLSFSVCASSKDKKTTVNKTFTSEILYSQSSVCHTSATGADFMEWSLGVESSVGVVPRGRHQGAQELYWTER